MVLINPNSSAATTEMMLGFARGVAFPGILVDGRTASTGPAMITTPEALDEAASSVIEIAVSEATCCFGIIVAAFGDPGCDQLKSMIDVPTVGICEAAMMEASLSRERFGVVTTTPKLAGRIFNRAKQLGLQPQFAGTWLAQGDAIELAADPYLTVVRLREAIGRATREGGVGTIIVGGGPLAAAAEELRNETRLRIINPVAAASKLLCSYLQ